jgi:DNA-binding transcriptional LysR family regulator
MSANWDDLKVLLAISRSGTLTGGAAMLGIDQSTAGRRLAALEADLGAILFIRSKLGFTPTAAGQAAISRALEMEARAIRLADEVANADAGPSGVVRLIGNPWPLVRLVELALPDLLSRHPDIQLRTIAGAQPRSLARGEAALALWFEMQPNPTEFAVKLGDVPYAIYKPRGADPARLGWVSFWDDEAPRRAPIRWIEHNRPVEEPMRLTATCSAVLRAAIRNGLGKGLLPMCLGEGDELLERVSPGPPELVRTLHLHAHPDTIQTARIQATMAWLRNNFALTFLPPGTAEAQEKAA